MIVIDMKMLIESTTGLSYTTNRTTTLFSKQLIIVRKCDAVLTLKMLISVTRLAQDAFANSHDPAKAVHFLHAAHRPFAFL